MNPQDPYTSPISTTPPQAPHVQPYRPTLMCVSQRVPMLKTFAYVLLAVPLLPLLFDLIAGVRPDITVVGLVFVLLNLFLFLPLLLPFTFAAAMTMTLLRAKKPRTVLVVITLLQTILAVVLLYGFLAFSGMRAAGNSTDESIITSVIVVVAAMGLLGWLILIRRAVKSLQ